MSQLFASGGQSIELSASRSVLPMNTQDFTKPSATSLAQMVKNLPAVQEMGVQSLGREDTLEKGMATYSSMLAWRIPRTEEPGGQQSMGAQTVGQT